MPCRAVADSTLLRGQLRKESLGHLGIGHNSLRRQNLLQKNFLRGPHLTVWLRVELPLDEWLVFTNNVDQMTPPSWRPGFIAQRGNDDRIERQKSQHGRCCISNKKPDDER